MAKMDIGAMEPAWPGGSHAHANPHVPSIGLWIFSLVDPRAVLSPASL